MATFLFGASSMLGWSILRAGGLVDVTGFCNELTRPLPAGVSRAIDLDDEAAVLRLFATERPALVIHCAGVCDVDTCERSPEFAHAVNVEGTRFLVAHAPADARIVYLSSDHVFSGDGGPYREDTAPDPLTVYGRTRVAAEGIVLARANTVVVRAGLWIGPSANGRVGHLDWLRYRHERRLPMTVIGDEVRSAVWADAAARRVAAIARSTVTGIRHITATRAVSRPELARYLSEHYAIGAELAIGSRGACATPHLGKVELATGFGDELAAPLPSVVPASVVI